MNAETKVMLAAVDELAEQMKRKLRVKDRAGYSGGLEASYRSQLVRKLREHVEILIERCPCCDRQSAKAGEGARQAIDVANLAMMLWVQGGKPRA